MKFFSYDDVAIFPCLERLPQFNEFTVDNFGPKIIPPRCRKSYLSMYIEGLKLKIQFALFDQK